MGKIDHKEPKAGLNVFTDGFTWNIGAIQLSEFA